MNSHVTRRLDDVIAACVRHHVQRLSLFGSATGDRFRPGESDIDFVVEFQPLEPGAYAEAYFGLIEDLEGIFGAEIDLIERSAIRNPYFLEAVEGSEIQLFDAA